ncbi:MAG TPA: FliH/SctL family protein [Candidatus Omnitrophota bacterium]|nr:FliH/SctL family protein [Candidatus Omnitrophota bacterium]
MTKPRKYMFDLDFDHPNGAPKAVEPAAAPAVEELPPEPEPEPPPMFSEEELAIARDSAFEEGRQAGLAEAAEATERMIAQALGTIAGQMDAIFRAQEEANDDNARTAARVGLAVVKKMLPAACAKHAFDEVAQVVEEVIGHILDEPRIIVRVGDGLVEPVRERLEAVAQSHGFEGRVVVQADPRLVAGDCRVEWTDGGAERDQARLMQEIEAAVERALAPAEAGFGGGGDGEFAGT